MSYLATNEKTLCITHCLFSTVVFPRGKVKYKKQHNSFKKPVKNIFREKTV